jgi:hypothetical protein
VEEEEPPDLMTALRESIERGTGRTRRRRTSSANGSGRQRSREDLWELPKSELDKRAKKAGIASREASPGRTPRRLRPRRGDQRLAPGHVLPLSSPTNLLNAPAISTNRISLDAGLCAVEMGKFWWKNRRLWASGLSSGRSGTRRLARPVGLGETTDLDLRRVRAAKNQSVFRDLNERIEDISEGFDRVSSILDLICECEHETCHEHFEMTQAEYEAVRRVPTNFAGKAGHEIAGVEETVDSNERYIVVAKLGVGGEWR